MSVTYLFYRNTLLNDDLHNDLTVVKNTAEQMQSNSNEDISIDITGKPTIASVQTISNTQSLGSVISCEITESIMSSNDSISTPTDTIKSVCDTTTIVPTSIVKQELIADEGFAPISHSSEDAWKIRVATNVLGLRIDGNGGDAASGPMSDPSTGGGDHQETEPTTSVHHLMPITFGVRFSKEISPSWSIESGLQYNLLRSEITNTIGNWSYIQNVRANYLSIPIAMSYNFMQINRTNMYVSGGISLDIPVGASISSDVNDETKSLKYPISVSPRIGLGFEYKITSSSMLFVQPTLNYHIMKKSDYPILWQDKPITFELPIGIRISW
jgi:hypothetical protein